MPKITYTVGLPGSGKSTWALAEVKRTGNTLMVSKDNIREMLFGPNSWTAKREKIVLRVRDAIIETALKNGLNVIVDDTNIGKGGQTHINRFSEIAECLGAELVMNDFTDVPLATCLERNRTPDRILKGRMVPEQVIYDMYRKIQKQRTYIPFNASLPDCYICDIDGTLAEMNGRGPFEEDQVSTDLVKVDVAKVVGQQQKQKNCKIIFFSGRTKACYDDTLAWIKYKAGLAVEDGCLQMREIGDSRPDEIVKRELYEAHVKGQYNVLGVFDDRKKVCSMWCDLGLTCFRLGIPDEDGF